MLEFDPALHVRTLVLVGVGGTGSALARSIGRILFDMKRRNMQIPPEVLFIDPDKVELNNVGRQSGFSPADVGHFKAEILATSLNYALGLEIRWIPEPFDPKLLGFGASESNTLIVGAVDNHLARRAISRQRAVWLDCGNTGGNGAKNFGQVVLGNSTDRVAIHCGLTRSIDSKIRYLPAPHIVFPSLLEPDPDEDPADHRSCADLIAANEQGLLANDLVSVVCSYYLYNLLHRIPVTSHITWINGDALTISSPEISPDQVLQYVPLSPEEQARKEYIEQHSPMPIIADDDEEDDEYLEEEFEDEIEYA